MWRHGAPWFSKDARSTPATTVCKGAASGAQEISYAGEALCVFVFGPVLTYVLIRGLSRHRRAAPSEDST